MEHELWEAIQDINDKLDEIAEKVGVEVEGDSEDDNYTGEEEPEQEKEVEEDQEEEVAPVKKKIKLKPIEKKEPKLEQLPEESVEQGEEVIIDEDEDE